MSSQPDSNSAAPLGAASLGTAASGSAPDDPVRHGPSRGHGARGSHLRGDRALLPLMLIYGAASLLHFLHNAVYLHDYPNLPVWLTSGGVFAAWLVVAGIGVLGYLLYSRVSREAGLIAIAAYAALGLGGLDHYTVAPVSAHTVAMNLTILLEAATAVVLLAGVVRSALSVRAQRAKLRV